MAISRCGSPTSRSASSRSASCVEADRRKDEFLATLAHELRNPLAPIRQAATIARNENATEAQKRWSNNVIERQVQHMSLLLDDLLDVSRITHGTLQLRKQQTDLQSIVGAAVETARPLIDERRHQLTLDVPPQLCRSTPIRCVSRRCCRTCSRTRRSTPIRRARSASRRTQVQRRSASSPSRTMASASRPRICRKVFGMFAQVRSAQDHAAGGLGIGLALAKGIVELHGGRIEAASAGTGKGSRFTVRLPATSMAVAARSAAGTGGVNGHAALTSASCSPTTTATRPRVSRSSCGSKDTRWISRTMAKRRSQASPSAAFDVALLDIGMPKTNGYEVARQIRAAPGGQAVLLIAITGWAQDSDKAQSRAAGFDHHLTKPIEPEALIGLLA